MNNLDLKIMYVIGLLIALWMSPVQAEEANKTNPVVDRITSVGKSIKNGLTNEWNDIKDYQKKSWEYGGANTWKFINMKEDFKYHWRKNKHEGSKQLARNREQIKAIPDKIKQSALGIGEFVQAITGVNKK